MGRSISRTEQLSGEEIVEAALRLTKRVGLKKITMRGLSDELRVTPMATYYYVKSKDALIQLVVNAVLARVTLPTAEGMSGEDRLWSYLRDIRLATQEYPGVAEYLLHSELTPAGKELFKGSLQILEELGFDESSARLAFSAIYAYTYGRAAFQTMAAEPGNQTKRRKPARALPTLEELASEEHAELGHQALMLGLRALLTPAAARSGQ